MAVLVARDYCETELSVAASVRLDVVASKKMLYPNVHCATKGSDCVVVHRLWRVCSTHLNVVVAGIECTATDNGGGRSCWFTRILLSAVVEH